MKTNAPNLPIVILLLAFPGPAQAGCPPDLYHLQPNGSQPELTEAEKSDYIQLMTEQKNEVLKRSETNSTESIAHSSSGQETFIREINFDSFFSLEANQLYEGDDWGTYKVDLMESCRLIARNLFMPVQNVAEIVQMQEVFKELIRDRALLDGAREWRIHHGWEPDIMRHLVFGAPVLKMQSTVARDTAMSLEFLIALPDRLDAMAESLKTAQSLRLRQMRWYAQQMNLEGIRAIVPQLKELLGRTLGSADPGQLQALNEATALASTAVPGMTFFQRVFYLQNQYNYFSVLAQFVSSKGWKFPEVLARNGSSPYLKIVNGHSPMLLADPGAPASVGNSLEMGFDGGQQHPNVLMITGPNAEGKSTLLRMVAQNLLLGMMGLPVPADQMTFTPTALYYHLNPSDAPSQNMSLFVNQAQELRKKVFERVAKGPDHVIFLDEILPGTIPALRTAAEKVFLRQLAPKNALVFVATHNWGTTTLEQEDPSRFRNVHVEKFALKPGAQANYEAMIQGAADALRKAGWPDAEIEMFVREASVEAQKD